MILVVAMLQLPVDQDSHLDEERLTQVNDLEYALQRDFEAGKLEDIT